MGSLKNFYMGIDLGTTNSVIAMAVGDKNDSELKKVEVVKTKRITSVISGTNRPEVAERETLPSCVYYREQIHSNDYQIIVGEFAKSQFDARPDFVVKSIKSQMGKPDIKNVSTTIPDKTPEQVSSRILKAMFDSIKKTYKYEIHDAVITVPASFDISQREATLRAAELAGINIRNSNGSLREILLSEPEAVIYNLINEMKTNAFISDYVLDFSKKLNILVFDIGGGTLDITFHQVERSRVNSEHYTVDTVATNRYTHLAGDTFDEAIAEEMFKRYLKQNEKIPDVQKEFMKNHEKLVSHLMSAAEDLKLQISEAVSASKDEDNLSLWGVFDDDIEERAFDVSGLTRHSYPYYDTFTKAELEKILSPFMGRNLSYNDYHNVSDIKDTYNIIYPVLYVLSLAAENLKTDDVKVDAVILNGGTSKFYMIQDRLEEFFGFKPLMVTDPDLSVAKGAAIYRFYQRNEMPVLRTAVSSSDDDNMKIPEKIVTYTTTPKKVSEAQSGIYSGSLKVSQPLYISSVNGVKNLIVDVGEELPFRSPKPETFRINANQTIISVPICDKDEKGNYKIIAEGRGNCRKYYTDTYVSVWFYLNRNKILTFEGVRSFDRDGKNVIENIVIEINFNIDSNDKTRRNRLQAPIGSALNVKDHLNNLERLHQYKNYKYDTHAKIKAIKQQIIGCSNKNEFAEPLLSMLESCRIHTLYLTLIVIARKICSCWTDEQKRRLIRICNRKIKRHIDMQEFYTAPPKDNYVSSVIESINTIGRLGTAADAVLIDKIKDEPSFRQSCLYAFANIQMNLDWIYQQFRISIKNNKYIQQTVWAMGVALRRNGLAEQSSVNPDRVVDYVCNIIRMNDNDTINVAVTALGLICDKRPEAKDTVSDSTTEKAINLLDEFEIILSGTPSFETAVKLARGIKLNNAEEEYLLEYIEK